jgi:hypothetical protein
LFKSRFDKLLLEAVDEGLSSLGESSKQAIYFHLAKSFNVKRNAIPFEIVAFAEAIEKIFGLGANFLEVLIMKHLHGKIGVVFDWNESKKFVFAEYVMAAKRKFEERQKQEITMELVECEEVRVGI